MANPRVVHVIPRQGTFTHFTASCDIDHAQCVRAREGNQQAWSSQGFVRSLIAPFQGGGAEFFGLVGVLSASLCEHILATDWRMKLGVRILKDATATGAFGSRRGV